MIVLAVATGQELSSTAETVSMQALPDMPGLFSCRINGIDALLLRTGIGHKKAGAVCRRLMSCRSPSAVIAIGAAGAADPGLSIGDLIVCERILQASGGVGFSCDARLAGRIARKLSAAGMTALRADCCSAAAFIHAAADKSAIFKATGARVIDMESAALARCCADAAVPFAGIRIVSDTARTDAFNISAFYASRKKFGRLGAWRYFAENPAELVRLLSLQRHVAGVSRAIATVVEALFAGEQLIAPADAP